MNLPDLLPLAQARNPYIKPGTLAQYRHVLSLADQWQPGIDCASLFTPEALTAFVGWLAATPLKDGSTRSRRTVKGRLQTVLTLWRLAQDAGAAGPIPPRDKLPRIKPQREDPVAWSIPQVRRILYFASIAKPLRHWTPSHWHTLLATFFVSSERAAALIKAQIEHLDGCVLSVLARTTKDGKPGTTHLPAWLAEAIRELPRLEGDSRIWQWPWNLDSLRRHYKRDILAKAGLATDGNHLFHCLRRSGITELVNELGIEEATKRARHSTPHITITSYVSEAKLRSTPASDVLGNAIR